MKLEASKTMNHIYAVRALEKLPGLFRPRRYFYHCARCKWSFIVNDGRRGSITAVSDNGKALDHDEAVRRVATFAAGPCPSMEILARTPMHLERSHEAAPPRAERRNRSESRLSQLFPFIF